MRTIPFGSFLRLSLIPLVVIACQEPVPGETGGVGDDLNCEGGNVIGLTAEFVGNVENDDIDDFCSGHCVRNVVGNVSIVNSSLTDLEDLSCIQSITGSLKLEDNANLTSVSGLEDLASIDTDLLIKKNPKLTDVSALHGLDKVGKDIVITDNALLKTSDAEALANAIETLGGAETISGNAN